MFPAVIKHWANRKKLKVFRYSFINQVSENTPMIVNAKGKVVFINCQNIVLPIHKKTVIVLLMYFEMCVNNF